MLPIATVQFFRSQGCTPSRAVALARAEAWAADNVTAEWAEDPVGAGAWGDHDLWCADAAKGKCQGHETLSVVLRSAAGEIIASLGGIIDPPRAYARLVEAELAEEAMAEAEATAERARRPYCRPLAAGLHSSERAVANRLARLLNALDTEISGHVVDGRIVDGVNALRADMLVSLRAEGWGITYDDSAYRWRVRVPQRRRARR